MKKVYGILIALVVVGGGITAALLMKQGSTAPNAQNVSSESLKTYDACQLLTKEKAAHLLGTASTLSDQAAPASSDDLKVTNCTYNNNAGTIRDIISASVLVRSPLTSTGVQSNVDTFNDTSIVGDMPVAGYGEKAMWNTTTGQLNILKDSNWIIITYGKTTLGSRTLDEAKHLADSLF